MKYLVILLALLTVPSAPLAETDPPSTIVLLIAQGQIIDSEGAVEAVRSQLDDLEAVLEPRWISADDAGPSSLADRAEEMSRKENVAAVVWVDGDDPSKLFFVAVGENGVDRFERAVPVDTTDIIKVENIALICRATVQALLAMADARSLEPVGLPTSDPAEPVPGMPSPDRPVGEGTSPAGSPPTPEPRDTISDDASPKTERAAKIAPVVGIDLAYAYRGYSSDDPVVHGFVGGLHGRIGKWGRIVAGYELRQPYRAKGACVDISARSHPFFVGGAVEWRFDWVSLGPYLGVTMEYITHETASDPACRQVRLFSAQARFDALVSLGAVVRFHIFDRFSFFARLVADIFVLQGRYSAPTESGERELLLDPWRAQPAAVLGISVGVI